MSVRNDEGSSSELEPAEVERPRPPLRLNLLRWDSAWIRERLAKVQDDLDRAVEELENPSDK